MLLLLEVGADPRGHLLRGRWRLARGDGVLEPREAGELVVLPQALEEEVVHARPHPAHVLPEERLAHVVHAREHDHEVGLERGDPILDEDPLVGRGPPGVGEREDLVPRTEEPLEVGADRPILARGAAPERDRAPDEEDPLQAGRPGRDGVLLAPEEERRHEAVEVASRARTEPDEGDGDDGRSPREVLEARRGLWAVEEAGARFLALLVRREDVGERDSTRERVLPVLRELPLDRRDRDAAPGEESQGGDDREGDESEEPLLHDGTGYDSRDRERTTARRSSRT